ncbi:putative dihydrodipicolinate synthase [Nocardia nova SH22a]|uniref:Putative dihydrodipicolinate synthase n=1 Tax=Nocardia nova SH22a TaxID=1415166 RepID=W5TC51_9NOCA|nr:dihydrodipicolinate synthase family protein [Nocardia nova]AHH16905.1 putative dihydrodipicolinate synthase [Nocardia nova SH22a]
MIGSPIVATLTPFRRDGRVDFGALGDYLDMLRSAAVESILVNGTTGEFASLTAAERKQILEFCRTRWPGRLIAHVGASAVGDVADLVRHANDLADNLAVIAPYYFAGPSEAGVERFFAEVLEQVRKPVLLYSFPRHTQVCIGPELVERLATGFPLLCGVKDSGKDVAVSRAYKERCPRLEVFLGDDRVGARMAELGLDGVVTGAGGPVAELPVAIAAAVRRAETGTAEHWQEVFDRYTDRRKSARLSDIAFAKSVAAARIPGFPTRVRPPLIAAEAGQQDDIRDFLNAQIVTRLP